MSKANKTMPMPPGMGKPDDREILPLILDPSSGRHAILQRALKHAPVDVTARTENWLQSVDTPAAQQQASTGKTAPINNKSMVSVGTQTIVNKGKLSQTAIEQDGFIDHCTSRLEHKNDMMKMYERISAINKKYTSDSTKKQSNQPPPAPKKMWGASAQRQHRQSTHGSGSSDTQGHKIQQTEPIISTKQPALRQTAVNKVNLLDSDESENSETYEQYLMKVKREHEAQKLAQRQHIEMENERLLFQADNVDSQALDTQQEDKVYDSDDLIDLS